MIVDFLIHLREDKGFSLLALKGYLSTINSVFTLKGMDLANSKELSMLFRIFAKTCSPQDLRPPAWDVALVLQSLTNQPYEPIREAEERFLTQMTLFLIALASAKRVGELHALSYRVSDATDWKEVSFSFVPGFVAKTQDQSSFDPRFENFTLPAVPKSSSSPNGRLLCPVRAVKRYLDRTSQHRPRCERLFVTSGHTKKEISKNTVSFWLRKVISLAYQLSGKPLPSPSPLTRETRGISPSLLFKKNYTVSQILKALPSCATTSETCHTSHWIPSTRVQWWWHRPRYNWTWCPRIPQLSHTNTCDSLSSQPALSTVAHWQGPYTLGKYSTTMLSCSALSRYRN